MSFTFTSKTTDFTTQLSNPINLIGKKYEVALIRLETFNSFPNVIENVNNIFRYSPNNGHYDTINTESYINILIFASRVIVIIKNDTYRVDFNIQNSIGKILGFSPMFLNGSNSQIIYIFAPAVRPGAKIIETPSPLEFLPIPQSMINSVRIWLTDEDNKPIDNIGEDLVVRLSIKEILNIEESFINAMNKMKE